MKCSICKGSLFTNDKKISSKCNKCNVLYNLEAKELDYSNGGGQDTPSGKKSKSRIKNALKRFEIISPYINNKNIFVDIGCGSGEMLEASKFFFKHHIGYDENKILINYTQKKGLNTYNNFFQKKDLDSFEQDGVALSISHVLEHISEPMVVLKSIISELNKGDVIYIEVPLYTGYSFKNKKYDWSLWYHEHVALYSMETLEFIAKELNLNILDKGYRNFVTDNYSKKLALKLFISNPLRFVMDLYNKKKYHLLLDNTLKDYGFIVLEI